MSYLAPVARPQQRRRWPLIVTVAAVALVVLVGAGALIWAVTSGNSPTPTAAAASPTVASTPAASATSSAASQSPAAASTAPAAGGVRGACVELDRLVKAGKFDDFAALQQIGDTMAETNDSRFDLKGMLLRDTAADAVAAKGTSSEAKLADSTKRSAESVHKACVSAGYVSA
ncbi:hypothetical protein ABZS66_37325 [Dactylosporangium sp. NPDC005572]|uniref:hypothetical protein n=1 Tax=Dactylosporangium sp. NPDC005572 TaxID=3156889 RepID=UPI0033BDAB32